MTTQTLTAEDLGKRVIDLIGSIRGAEDIAPANIEKTTGMKVAFNPDDKNEYGFGGRLSEAWNYNLVSLTEADGSKPSRLLFSFDAVDGGYPDVGPACMDFEDAAAALKAAGYASTAARGKHAQVLYWDFVRGGAAVQVYVRGESDEKASHACVSKIIINA